jgi:hypothetical protein
MTGIIYSAMTVLLMAGIGCRSMQAFNETEKEKLDQPLQQALSGSDISSRRYDVSTNKDGIKVYGVIIRAKSPDEIKQLGIKFNSFQGDMMTAKLTAGEIRQIINLDSVIRIETGLKNYINQ